MNLCATVVSICKLAVVVVATPFIYVLYPCGIYNTKLIYYADEEYAVLKSRINGLFTNAVDIVNIRTQRMLCLVKYFTIIIIIFMRLCLQPHIMSSKMFSLIMFFCRSVKKPR